MVIVISALRHRSAQVIEYLLRNAAKVIRTAIREPKTKPHRLRIILRPFDRTRIEIRHFRIPPILTGKLSFNQSVCKVYKRHKFGDCPFVTDGIPGAAPEASLKVALPVKASPVTLATASGAIRAGACPSLTPARALPAKARENDIKSWMYIGLADPST